MGYGADVERLLLLHRTLVNARKNEEARPALEQVGYSPEELERGQQLYTRANELIITQSEEALAYVKAQEALRTFETALNHQYTIDRAIAKREFADAPKVQEYLGVDGRQARTQAGRSEQGRKLYSTELSEANAALLAAGGLTAERRAERWAKVKEAQKYRAQVLAALSKREQATTTRNQAIKKALAWITGFRNVARKLFKEHPHLLELFELK